MLVSGEKWSSENKVILLRKIWRATIKKPSNTEEQSLQNGGMKTMHECLSQVVSMFSFLPCKGKTNQI